MCVVLNFQGLRVGIVGVVLIRVRREEGGGRVRGSGGVLYCRGLREDSGL